MAEDKWQKARRSRLRLNGPEISILSVNVQLWLLDYLRSRCPFAVSL